MKKIRIGLALGSGGAKGLSHIGVLKILEEENIKISFITGSSIGALIGGLYAKGYTAKELENLAIEIAENKEKFYNLFDLSKSLRGIIKGDKILEYIDELLNGVTFEKLLIPFIPIAVDLISGEKVYVQDGKVSEGIRGSISIPVIFEPFPWKDKLLIDGGVLAPLPVRELKEIYKPDIIIGVSLHKRTKWNLHNQISINIPYQPHSLSEKIVYKLSQTGLIREFQRRLNPLFNPSFFEVLMQTIDIMNYKLEESNIREADIVIIPEVDQYETFSFEKAKEIIKKGEIAAREKIDQIKNILKKKKRRFWFF